MKEDDNLTLRNASEVDIEKKADVNLTEEDKFLVEFKENDPHNPKNWSVSRKWYTTVLTSVFILSSTIASSLPSTIIANMMIEFQTTQTIAICTITVFLLGYVFGPLFFGPGSEVFGRKPVFVVTLFVYAIFNIGCALSPNITGLLLCRLFSGIGASSPLTNSGGVLTDIWEMDQIAIPMALFSITPFMGPVIGPIIGNFMIINVDWEYIYWLLLAFGGVCWLLTIFTLKESYAPIILQNRAQKLRKETGDDRYYTKYEKVKPPMKELIKVSLTRPLLFLFTEPIVIFSSIYVSIVYAILYLSFEIVPYVFRGVYEMKQQIAGLMFIPIAIGMFINLAISIILQTLAKRSQRKPTSEDRLVPAIYLGGPCLVISLFWLGFTSKPEVPWQSPAASLILFGIAIVCIFTSFLSYLADVYSTYSASALASNTIARSILGAVCPLFVQQMFDAMGIDYACMLLGIISFVLLGVPIWFKIKASSLRARSNYARKD
ncbi:MFS general substrate transporter [Wallemia mellicola CBS 633.66]|uniref:MFS general substrate transporter n=2 Tax=Wallemia mellicola TaxID=1708541 RepID=A0A4T0RRR7_9BASI|nr:MFS general substrate transporter [Wallemia mellicola CBS 633.66]TIB70308.1 hypothetical protein E3Q24_03043 [Wallemia mellicola]EIM24085.1 MFS general substrate transporter [Wallemia mellicola CBS 633.66]TIB88302.1 MFS general substrate transporter [Wallemia mellicola]TIB91177.1 MFS general substrate transporter [Wallemia mellicola]TIB94666.1 MFS general substrate transporter [Wallemia mellicola]|eukprot:XP_006955911.1 MFS general substrate transporter [Wallemia mellicola CBS 633.66]